MRIWVSAVIVLSSYFGILQSVREQRTVSAGPGVYLCLKGKTNFTGGIIPINVIGETTNNVSHPHLGDNDYENNGLQCITDKPNCCRVNAIKIGEWYFPNGTAVPILGDGNNSAITFYRNRGYNDSTVNLNRVSSNVMSPTGNFCCKVPDSVDKNRTVCANITTVTVTIMSIPPAISIVGENLTLQCSAEGAGDFLTQIKWLNLQLTDGMNIQTNGPSIQLQFIPLQASHNGMYTCQATVGDMVFSESYSIVTMAPSSPQYFSTVSDMTTVLFSWATPLHPRVVANYTLTCVPLSEGIDPLIMTYTEAGSYTLRGFRPATVYNCSIVATNSIGSSAPSVINTTTVDQSSRFHLWLMKIDNCTEWMVMDAGQKLNDISSAIVDNIENHCQCRFIRDRITDEAFQCTDNGLEAVAYAATVHGTASVNSSILIAHIKQWATDGATVVILHEVLNISSMGPINGECCTERTMMKEITTSGSLLNDTQAKPIAKDNNHTLFIILGGGSGGGVVVIVIIIIIIVIGTIVKCKNRKRRKLRIHKTELVQEEKELNRYKNLCASRLQEGVYIEECDYGEIKGQHRGQEDHENVTHHHHHSATNEYEESTQVTQKSDEPEYENIMKSHTDDQSQATSHQQSVLPLNKLAVDKYKSHQSASATKHQMPRESTYDVDEEVYEPQQPMGKGQRAPYHPEAMEDCSENKLDCQNYYNYTAIPQSSAAGSGTTRYQPLLSRERDYENNLKGYNSINASQQQDDRGSDEEYEYVTTKLRYYYQPSVK